MIVRRALAVDRTPAVEVWRAAQAGRGFRPPAARLARIEQKVTEGLLVVAVEASTETNTETSTEVVLGMALGESGRESGGDVVPGLLHLSMVFVEPARQRQGIGSALVEGIADEAWGQGYRSVSVWTRTPAFYEACGLEPTGAVDDDLVQLAAELEAPLREVVVRSEGIRLGQLLKLAELVETGAEGKALLTAEQVEVNGEVEVRRGRQLVDGDEVRTRDQAVRVRLLPT